MLRQGGRTKQQEYPHYPLASSCAAFTTLGTFEVQATTYPIRCPNRRCVRAPAPSEYTRHTDRRMACRTAMVHTHATDINVKFPFRLCRNWGFIPCCQSPQAASRRRSLQSLRHQQPSSVGGNRRCICSGGLLGHAPVPRSLCGPLLAESWVGNHL